MSYRIKNWSSFQHFKDRCPPWIKLYRDLLDDPDWHDLDAEAAKVLVMLWVLASEDCGLEGRLPDIRRMAFRLRIGETELQQHLQALDHWLIQDDITMISDRYHNDTPETEAEKESEADTYENATVLDEEYASIQFEDFWQEYPRKQNKAAARKAWKKLKVGKELFEEMMKAIKNQKKSKGWRLDDGKFIPHASTWLNNKRWEDEIEQSGNAQTPDYMQGVK